MIQQDFFMRYVEEAGKVIARALGFKEKGEPQKGLEVIQQTWSGLLDVNLQTLKNTADDALIAYLTGQLAFSLEKLEATAELLFWEGQFLLHANSPQNAELCFRKARIVLEEVMRKSGTFNQLHQHRMAALATLLMQEGK